MWRPASGSECKLQLMFDSVEAGGSFHYYKITWLLSCCKLKYQNKLTLKMLRRLFCQFFLSRVWPASGVDFEKFTRRVILKLSQVKLNRLASPHINGLLIGWKSLSFWLHVVGAPCYSPLDVSKPIIVPVCLHLLSSANEYKIKLFVSPWLETFVQR